MKLIVGLAFVVLLASVTGCGSSPESSASAGKLVFSPPRGLHDYRLDSRDVWSPGVGHVLTNFPLPGRRTVGWVLSWWAGASANFMAVKKHDHGPPSDEVALELVQLQGPFGCIGPCPPPRLLHLPLSPDHGPWFQERLASGAPGYRYGYLRFRGDNYKVLYWIGADAPANDRAAVLHALRSIRPREVT
jgi:hypothetical protein